MDDDALSSAFDRIAAADRSQAPSIEALRRRSRRRHRRRAIQASVLVVTVLGIGASVVALTRSTGQHVVQVAGPGGGGRSSVAPDPDRVFTVGAVPPSLAYQSCVGGASEADPDGIGVITCTYDDPATPNVDGLRITRVIGGATAAATRAWGSGDGLRAATASGGADATTDPHLVTISDKTVLQLGSPGHGETSISPVEQAAPAYRLLVGTDLVDLGTQGLSLADVDTVVAGLTDAAPRPEVKAALVALPRGSVALVQGARPSWILTTSARSAPTPFGGTTTGALLLAPSTTTPVDIAVTTGIDAGPIVDVLRALGDTHLADARIGGRPAVVIDAGGQLPRSVPGPRSGPQVLIATGDRRLVRVGGTGAPIASLRSLAEALL
ncbi:hypothetical protein [Aquihabitans sp. McL0605]|uniref:hypothetical protein n=1 Tax=Aquihabitans sp. McL0605 TaxID=3415671 RepID=UPI003CE924A4